MSLTSGRLELTATLDNFLRHQRTLQDNIEGRMLDFVVLAEKFLSEDKCDGKCRQKLEADIEELQTENRNLKMRLTNARKLLDIEKAKRIGLQYDKDTLESKILAILEAQKRGNIEEMSERVRAVGRILVAADGTAGSVHEQSSKDQSSRNSSFFSDESSTIESIVSVSELNFTAEDEADLSRTRSGRFFRRLNSGFSLSNHKRKSFRSRKCSSRISLEMVEEMENKENVIPNNNGTSGPTPPLSPVQLEDGIGAEGTSQKKNKCDDDGNNTLKRSYNTPIKPLNFSPSLSPVCLPIGLTIRNSKRLQRHHRFTSKTFYRVEQCQQCEGKIKFREHAFKCMDCKSLVHSSCRDNVPLPCVPILDTAGGSKRKSQSTIADYSPRISPMVPALIVHSTNEIERRGLGITGLYRVAGSGKQVRELRDRFLEGKSLPNLTNIDILVIADTVKSFLLFLKEPVIPLSLWRDFVAATQKFEEEDTFAMCYQSIADMPQPNRDTLAWLMCHLQKVSESVECQMPISNLAMIFGPSIVGCSMASPQPELLLNEVIFQQKVMELLLNIPADYWQTFINVAEPIQRTCSTPANFCPPIKKLKASISGTPF